MEEELTVMLSDWHDRSPVEKMLRYLELEKQQEQNPMDPQRRSAAAACFRKASDDGTGYSAVG